MNCTPQEQTDAEQYIDSPDFITEVAKRNPESKPWAMQFGGWGEAVADALEGGTHKRDPVVVGANTGELRAERAVAVLEELGKLSEQDTTTVEVSGTSTS